jgi:hypothetical protein
MTMVLTGQILATLLAKGLATTMVGGHPAGWTRIGGAIPTTIVIERRVIHHARRYPALVLSADPFSGGSGAFVTPSGRAPCRFTFAVTDSALAHYCVAVSGCGLDGSACTGRLAGQQGGAP